MTLNPMSLTGRTLMVTGASSGIGREAALQLAAAGCNLALADMNGDSLDKVADACRKLGVKVLWEGAQDVLFEAVP